MATTLYLIRHAQSHPSSGCHHSKWPLSTLGKAQAKKLADLIRLLGIQKVFTSPYLRCVQTIEPFRRRFNGDVIVKEDLRERLIVDEIVDDFNSIWRKSWQDFDFAVPGCESSSQAQIRFARQIEAIVKENPGKTIAISSHGNVISLFLNSIDENVGIKFAESLMNPDVLKIVCNNGVFKLDSDFHLHGIEEFASNHSETPVEK